MNHYKTLVIPALIFAMILPACNSIKAAVSTPVNGVTSDASQPTSTIVVIPTAAMPPGTSPGNPAPVGFGVNADNMKFVVSGLVRPADGLVASGNMFNSQPGGHQQYILVSLQITCDQSMDQQCHLKLYKMTLLGSDGILSYPERLTTGVDNILENSDFNRGEIISGYVPFIISIGDSRLSLIYESLSGESFYLALP